MNTERRQINPEKLRRAREKAGIGAYDAASVAQITPQAYYRWENASKGPVKRFDYLALRDLAAHLGCEVDALTDPLDQGGSSTVPSDSTSQPEGALHG